MNIRRTIVAVAVVAAVGAAAAGVTLHRSFNNRDTGFSNGSSPGARQQQQFGGGAQRPAGVQPTLVKGKAPNKLFGMIDEVIDGGLVRVVERSGAKSMVRLTHIEAPRPGQPFSDAAKKFLGDLTRGKEVEVLWTKKGSDGVIAGELYYRHEKYGMVDANLTMVKNGAAWHARNDSQKVYADAEKEARAAKRGLWGDPKPVRPSLWKPPAK